MLAALAAELEQGALDRADRLLRDIAIRGGEFVGAFAAADQHRLQIVQVEQQQPVFVGDVKGDRQHAFLHLVQVHQTREQQRPHFGDGGANGMALFAIEIPELHGRIGIGPGVVANFLGACGKDVVILGSGRSGHGEARQIALHIGDEARDSVARKAFDDALDGDGLAGAGRARDQPVAIGALEFELLGIAATGTRAKEDTGRFVHEASRDFGEKLSREKRGGGRKIPLPWERRERDR
ncbi:hypothetical protein D9M73_108540 [compost metagenome]